MPKDFIMITGATGLIGRVYADYFSSLGYNLVLTGRDIIKLNKLKGDLAGRTHIEVFSIDHAAASAASDLVDQIKKKDVLPAYLINNVRDINNIIKPDLGEFPAQDQWLNSFQLGVIFPYKLVMGLKKHNVLRSVVNVSSMYGVVVPNIMLYGSEDQSPVHYGIIKAAQNHLTKELAVRLAKDNIKVNAIAYGGVDGRVNNDFKKKYAKLCPKERMLKKSEVLDSAKYFLLDANEMVTGQVMCVSGGWELW